ncbi:hypothetical protein [Salmonirosea aquatica]|uniref:Uncharacterized protein n=1 Tax=Salmonirosea aquatica TaxID=2654236 RepID=A0A7C9BJG2_9BACT|nr:hypothetical protein [Cytophagaceae bacterium SJW1-29]
MIETIFLQLDSTHTNADFVFFKEWADYIIGIPTFIISTLLAFWIYKKQSFKKELSYFVKDKISLININSEYRNRFKIQFDSKIINDLSLITIEIINTGNQPILKSDFENDIELDLTQPLNKKIDILSYEIIDRSPINISNSLIKKHEKLYISAALLNPKDNFKIQLLTDFEEIASISIKINSRISGINQINQINQTIGNDKSLMDKILREVTQASIKLILVLSISIISGTKLFQELLEWIVILFKSSPQ